MTVFQTIDLHALHNFSKSQDQLAVVERPQPKGANDFFKKLTRTPLRVTGKVYKNSSTENIEGILKSKIPTKLKNDPFYKLWISDMAQVCEVFCDTLESKAVGFCLGTKRGCRRYHVDYVPMRLLVTYSGQGTEWLPDEYANRRAFIEGEPNEKIITDPSARQFMNTWDIAIFRGGPKGLLHRTPDVALNGSSILMRLDRASFWDNMMSSDSAPIF